MTNNPQGCKGGKGCTGTSSNIYTDFKPLIQLHGKSYNPIKRAVFYSLIGSAIRDNKIMYCDALLDTRINLFIPLKSGFGKGEIKQVIKKTTKDLQLHYCEPTSLHHEQLIGKTSITKNVKHRSVKGHLSDDYLIFEESTNLFTDINKNETRKYIKIALDPIGQNEISKRNVDISKGKGIQYNPKCSMTFFFHPVMIDNTTVKQGLLRRGLIVFVNPTRQERMQALKDSNNSQNLNTHWKNWNTFLSTISSKTFNWAFTDDAKKLIITCTEELVDNSQSEGKKAKEYTDIMMFTLKNFLIKLSCIQAAIHHRSTVEPSDVETAFIDLKMFWNLQLDYVTEKVKGNFSYNETDDEKPWVKKSLKILYEKGSLSEETSDLMIKDYKEEIGKKFNIEKRTASNRYSQLKNKGYIDSKQIGRYKSSVWLTEKGKEYLGIDDTLASLQPLTNKQSIIGKIKNKLTPTSLEP